VAEGYERPAALFSFDLAETGLEYKVGEHFAVMPRNPEAVVDTILGLYHPEVEGSKLLSVKAVDQLGNCPFPAILTARELLTQTQYLDICGRPSKSFYKQLFMFASNVSARDQLCTF
jgi:sulfite reductase alpha subunit-like flavoprotein